MILVKLESFNTEQKQIKHQEFEYKDSMPIKGIEEIMIDHIIENRKTLICLGQTILCMWKNNEPIYQKPFDPYGNLLESQ